MAAYLFPSALLISKEEQLQMSDIINTARGLYYDGSVTRVLLNPDASSDADVDASRASVAAALIGIFLIPRHASKRVVSFSSRADSDE